LNCFLFNVAGPPRALPSFPTRRSSDLRAEYEALVLANTLHEYAMEVLGDSITDAHALTGDDRARYKAFTEAWVNEAATRTVPMRSEEHTSELQSLAYLVCRLLPEKKKQ